MKLKTQIFLSILIIGFIQAGFVIEIELMTYLLAVLSYLLIFNTISLSKKISVSYDFEYKKLLYFYLGLGIIAIFRGLFIAENYWDWKFMMLETSLVLILPFVSFIGSNINVSQAMMYNFIKYLLPVSILVYLASLNSERTDGFARFLSPLYFIILFFPLLTKKWKLILLLFVSWSFFSDWGARSNLIRIIAALGLVFIFYIRHFVPKWFYEIFRIILFVAPVILFVLAATNVFNVFKIGDEKEGKYLAEKKLASGEIRDDDLSADTRTFIYEEVISSGIYRNTWLFGESAVAGYISEVFEDYSLGSKGRTSSEVGILNVFNVLGIIGVIAFTLIYYFASFLCVNRSNNYICKLLGLFIAFRWTYSWIEEFTNFDMNYFFLWVVIGLCFSKSFRKMNDQELKIWVLGIFDKRYAINNNLI